MPNPSRTVIIRLAAAVAVIATCLSPAGAAASARSSMPETPAALPAPSEAQATEIAARFFDPLLAAAKTDRERASLLHQRGVLYLRADVKAHALSDLEEAVRLVPKGDEERLDMRFHRACAYLLLPTPNADAAIADLSACIAARPRDAEALLLRALAYRKRGSSAAADADVARARPLLAPGDARLQALLEAAAK